MGGLYVHAMTWGFLFGTGWVSSGRDISISYLFFCRGQVVGGCIYSGVDGCGGRFEAASHAAFVAFFWLDAVYHQYFGTSSTLDWASLWALDRGVTLRGII